MLSKMMLFNELKKVAEKYNVDIEIDIEDIVDNGELNGCKGYVTNKQTGSYVYLDTYKAPYSNDKVLYRLVENKEDYSPVTLVNGYNRWCKPDELAKKVTHLLKKEKIIKPMLVITRKGE